MEPAHGESCPSGQRGRPAALREDQVLSPNENSLHTSTTPTTRGRKQRLPGSIPARKVWKSQPNWLVTNWLRLMEPACGESCLSGQRRGPAAPREDNILSPDENSLHVSTTPTTRGRKQRSPRSRPPRKRWKPQPHWVIADWLGLTVPARGESCPSDQRRGPAAPGEDNFPSPNMKSFHISTTSLTRERKRRSPGSIPPRKVWKPQPPLPGY